MSAKIGSFVWITEVPTPPRLLNLTYVIHLMSYTDLGVYRSVGTSAIKPIAKIWAKFVLNAIIEKPIQKIFLYTFFIL